MDTAQNFFRTRREALGLTQREVAGQLDVAIASVCNWESGKNLPRLSMLGKLAEVYQVSTDELAREVAGPTALAS
jgi:transcriptional regulator with XRE-family HTH domain